MKLESDIAPRVKRIFIDMSHTADSGYNTGIQRVVRKLASSLPKVAQAKRIQCYPVVWRDGDFRVHRSEKNQPLDIRILKQDFSRRLPRFYQRFVSSVCRAPGLGFLQNQLLPEAGHLGFFSLPVRAYVGVSKSISRRFDESKPIDFAPGDCLILPDGYWVMMDIWPAIEAAKASGAFIHTIVYDLICMTHPHFFGPGASEAFQKYLVKVLQNSDLVTGISKTVRNQIRERSSEWRASGLLDNTRISPCIESIPLGAEIIKRRRNVLGRVRELFSHAEDAPYLMVSTFEPRKNHRIALEAVELLFNRNQPIRLVLAGRLGWMCEETMALVARLQSQGIDIQVFHELSDDEIDFCYERAKGVIYPSFVEGFGLPIVEALRHGRKTFVSDTPIHREVGQNDCVYFDPHQAIELADRIQDFERNLPYEGSRSTNKRPRRLLTSWSDCAKAVLQKILTTHASVAGIRNKKLVEIDS